MGGYGQVDWHDISFHRYIPPGNAPRDGKGCNRLSTQVIETMARFKDMAARYEQDGDIAVLTVNNPPVNALSAQMRADLFEGVARAVVDPAIVGIVIIGDPVFIAGADIREFGKPASFPGLRDLYPPMEDSPKPIVAAISGAALGGGYELALACHYRIMLANALRL